MNRIYKAGCEFIWEHKIKWISYRFISMISFSQDTAMILSVLLAIFMGFTSCNQDENPEGDCMVTEGIALEYTDPEGLHIRVFNNGDAYIIEEGNCSFAVQFFKPGFFDEHYIETDSGTLLKVEEGVYFAPFDSFEEDFEDYEETLDFLITDVNDRSRFFSAFTLQSPSAKTVDAYVDLRKCIIDGSCDFIDNRFDLAPDPTDPSNQVLKLFSVAPSPDMVTAKSSISSTLVLFQEGNDFWFEGRFFIEKGLPTTLADFETSYFEGGPGPRLIFKGDYLSVENKFNEKITYHQTAGSEVSFPTDKWVKVKVHLRYDLEAGIIRVWQDDQLIIDALGQNMPLTFWIQDRIEVGITATSEETILYLDDFKFSHDPL